MPLSQASLGKVGAARNRDRTSRSARATQGSALGQRPDQHPPDVRRPAKQHRHKARAVLPRLGQATSTPPGRFRYGGARPDIVAAGGAVGCLGHRLGRGQDGADPLGRMGGGRRPGLAKRAVALAKVVEDGRQIARNGRCDIRRPGQRRDAFRRSSPRSGPRRRRRPSPSRGPGWPAGRAAPRFPAPRPRPGCAAIRAPAAGPR